MTYQICQLGSLIYSYNPPEKPNPPVRVVTSADTLIGRYYNDFGEIASRKEINQVWPVMDCNFYAALLAEVAIGGTLTFIDDDGTSYTVIAMTPTYTRILPQGDAYTDVKMKLSVVSQP